MPCLIITSETGKRTETIDKSTLPLTIGRAQDNALILDDSSVSRHHAVIKKTGNRLCIEDAGSLNGLWVNGRPVHKRTELNNHDRVLIGDFEIEFLAN